MASQAEYFALDKKAGQIYDRVAETTDGHERTKLLFAAAEVEQRMADVHFEVFGADPNSDEGGRDLSESLTHSALLMRLIADVEQVACGETLSRFTTGTWLEPYAGPVLNRMVATETVQQRAALLEDLYDAVYPHVGGQAAETLACVPLADGMCGWSNERRWPSSFSKLARMAWQAWRESRTAR